MCHKISKILNCIFTPHPPIALSGLRWQSGVVSFQHDQRTPMSIQAFLLSSLSCLFLFQIMYKMIDISISQSGELNQCVMVVQTLGSKFLVFCFKKNPQFFLTLSDPGMVETICSHWETLNLCETQMWIGICYKSVEIFWGQLTSFDGQDYSISESMKGQCFGKESTWFNDEWKARVRNESLCVLIRKWRN